jgi:hypothetical protein
MKLLRDFFENYSSLFKTSFLDVPLKKSFQYLKMLKLKNIAKFCMYLKLMSTMKRHHLITLNYGPLMIV